MDNVGRYLIIGGIILILIGAGLYAATRLGLPLGRLPGDIRIEGKDWSVDFPIVTSILVSLVLTIILNLVLRFLHK